MKLALVLYLALSFWLFGCVQIQQKLQRPWAKIINELNQHQDDNVLLNDDLTQIYADELSAINELWLGGASKNKNAFFHEHITKANAQAFSNEIFYQNNNRAIAKEVLNYVASHPVASVENVLSFEDGDQIGFCFGRAMFVHYLLLKKGISPNDIKKVFVLGEFFVQGFFWRFHVAIMIKSNEGYLVVDPLYGEPLPFSDWIKNVQSIDIKKPFPRARYYVTDPRKFMPASGAYALTLLSQPSLVPYFFALGKSL